MRFSGEAGPVIAENSPGWANWSPWKPPQSQSRVHSYVHLPLSRRVCNIPLTPFSVHKLASLFSSLDSSVLYFFFTIRTIFLSFFLLFIILFSFILFIFPVLSFFHTPVTWFFYPYNYSIPLTFYCTSFYDHLSGNILIMFSLPSFFHFQFTFLRCIPLKRVRIVKMDIFVIFIYIQLVSIFLKNYIFDKILYIIMNTIQF